MKYFLLLIFFANLNSCTKEALTNYKTFWNNKTNHKIEITSYIAGVIQTDKIVTLLANGTKEIANGTDRGIVKNAGFNSTYITGVDSVIVLFDNQFKITHYVVAPPVFSARFYLYSSLRNVSNYLSYQYTYQDINKRLRESTYSYNFVEQDYLDAK